MERADPAGFAVVDAVAGCDAARSTGSGNRQVEREQKPRVMRVLALGDVAADMERRAAEASAGTEGALRSCSADSSRTLGGAR